MQDSREKKQCLIFVRNNANDTADRIEAYAKKSGIVLKESNLIISDAMFGLTEKIFGEDYYTIKKSIYKELEKLAKQIGAYLDLPQRMVYLQ